MLKWFNIKEYKRGYLPISHKACLSKNLCPKTQIKRDKMKIILYTLTIESIMYVILCTIIDIS